MVSEQCGLAGSETVEERVKSQNRGEREECVRACVCGLEENHSRPGGEEGKSRRGLVSEARARGSKTQYMATDFLSAAEGWWVK